MASAWSSAPRRATVLIVTGRAAPRRAIRLRCQPECAVPTASRIDRPPAGSRVQDGR